MHWFIISLAVLFASTQARSHHRTPKDCGPVCMISCPNGNVLDERGCPICRCRPSPPSNGGCQRDLRPNTQCNSPPRNECVTDADCFGKKMCCIQGCSKRCVYPKYNYVPGG